MLPLVVPAVAATLVWWFGTGAVLWLVRLPRRALRWTIAGASLALLPAFWGLAASAGDASDNGAYLAFVCVVVVWGWQEICFLTGVSTGPRTGRCPDGLGGWSRFVAATQAILYHELQLVLLGVAVVLATAGGVNPVGPWCFLVLWVMRLSAKLNLFLGVPFVHADWLPAPLQHLASYFRVRPMNWLFPLSVSLGAVATYAVLQSALAPDLAPFETTGRVLVGVLLALGVLEHWFMVLPIPVAALWAGFKARPVAAQATAYAASTIDRRTT